ncbi:hypothetical protein DRJ17_02410 [Candidatus Woesearchaeota archaeon]|nr:MAG: hypothetical protein DRJ17_02410 [Candidatus Woesearchaeota archaeon]
MDDNHSYYSNSCLVHSI